MGFFGGSSTYESLKANIRRDLSLHKREINLSSHGERALIDAVSDDPTLVPLIMGFRISRSFFSTTAHVDYAADAVESEYTEYAGTKEEAEGLLLYYLTCFNPKLCLVLPLGTDAAKLVKDFSDQYSVQYPAFRGFSSSYSEITFFGYTVMRIDFQYAISRYQLSQMDRKVTGAVIGLRDKLFVPEMPPLVKAYVAHNYLARTITYWKPEPKNAEELVTRHSAYGALIKNRCVCQGFAEAFMRIMDAEGIDCYVLHGKVYSDPSGPHAWNLVALKEGAFHVDATWDAQPTGAINTYFGMTDAYLTPLREWNHHFGKPARSGINWVKEAKRIISANLSEYLRKGIDRKYLVL